MDGPTHPFTTAAAEYPVADRVHRRGPDRLPNESCPDLLQQVQRLLDAGQANCGNANRGEEWCADFAAWVWRMAGVKFTYELTPGDINSASASFYVWGVMHGTWHPVGTGYVPKPGDVAVYGLNTGTLVATHVAVVTGYRLVRVAPTW